MIERHGVKPTATKSPPTPPGGSGVPEPSGPEPHVSSGKTKSSKEVGPNGKRRPPNAGVGRKKGSVNKTTALLKDAILKAAEEAGGKGANGGLVGYLAAQAKKNPAAFLVLLGKVLPMQIANDENGAFKVAMDVTISPAEAKRMIKDLQERSKG